MFSKVFLSGFPGEGKIQLRTDNRGSGVGAGFKPAPTPEYCDRLGKTSSALRPFIGEGHLMRVESVASRHEAQPRDDWQTPDP